MRALRPFLAASAFVLASQPVQALQLSPAYPATFTLVIERPATGDPLPGLIAQAQSRVLVETYAITDGPVIAALAAARGRGVDVRVMADPHSASSGATLSQLAGRDVWTRRGNPAFASTGQSAVVLDGTMLALSNAPLTQKARTTEHRFLVVDRDALDVQQAASVFYDDWERRTPVRYGHQTVLAPPDYQTDLIELINGATRTLDMMAESLTSPAIVQAVDAAALRQVKVRVLLNGGAPQSVLQALVEAGAVPRLGAQPFSGSAVGVDGVRVLVGSAALNDVSLQQQRELGLLIKDGGVSGAFGGAFEREWNATAPLHVVLPTATSIAAATAPPTPTHPARPVGNTPTLQAPTPTPPLTATPSVLNLTTGYNSSVRIGGRQQIVVRTLPGATVTITVTYPDGTTHNRGTTQGVGVADATGSFVDGWTVAPNTQTGNARAQIVVSAIGRTRTTTIDFTITL